MDSWWQVACRKGPISREGPMRPGPVSGAETYLQERPRKAEKSDYEKLHLLGSQGAGPHLAGSGGGGASLPGSGGAGLLGGARGQRTSSR